MSDSDIINGVQQSGRFDAIVESEAEARRLIQTALPDAIEIPAAVSGTPYPSPPKGLKTWYQLHPAEQNVGNDMPHIKYVDWSAGKKGKGGSWGHLFFPPV